METGWIGLPRLENRIDPRLSDPIPPCCPTGKHRRILTCRGQGTVFPFRGDELFRIVSATLFHAEKARPTRALPAPIIPRITALVLGPRAQSFGTEELYKREAVRCLRFRDRFNRPLNCPSFSEIWHLFVDLTYFRACPFLLAPETRGLKTASCRRFGVNVYFVASVLSGDSFGSR